MAHWLGVSAGPLVAKGSPPQIRFEDARLTQAIRPADPVALITLAPAPRLVAFGEVGEAFSYGPAADRTASVWVRVTRHVDPPVEVAVPESETGLHAITLGQFAALAELVGLAGPATRHSHLPPEWMVSVALPIEAESRADAVRAFWAYVQTLGPAELPAFVWPRGDELALQAYVLDEPVNLDPEED
jgi:hypothetical protein